MFYAAGLIECTAKVFATVEWSAKQYDANRPFGSWADDLAAAFVQLEPRQMRGLFVAGALSICHSKAQFLEKMRMRSEFLASRRPNIGFCAYVPISPAAPTICAL
jgi:hypothetical protein